MTATGSHNRYAAMEGLRLYADWLDSDSTIPVPAIQLGTRLKTAADVHTFARIHQLGQPWIDGNFVVTEATFGPGDAVVHRFFAPKGTA